MMTETHAESPRRDFLFGLRKKPVISPRDQKKTIQITFEPDSDESYSETTAFTPTASIWDESTYSTGEFFVESLKNSINKNTINKSTLQNPTVQNTNNSSTKSSTNDSDSTTNPHHNFIKFDASMNSTPLKSSTYGQISKNSSNNIPTTIHQSSSSSQSNISYKSHHHFSCLNCCDSPDTSSFSSCSSFSSSVSTSNLADSSRSMNGTKSPETEGSSGIKGRLQKMKQKLRKRRSWDGDRKSKEEKEKKKSKSKSAGGSVVREESKLEQREEEREEMLEIMEELYKARKGIGNVKEEKVIEKRSETETKRPLLTRSKSWDSGIRKFFKGQKHKDESEETQGLDGESLESKETD
eukprot:TRINITY_DN569_c1_g1_i1.p1 TRINITY_DN569_c1_g1~~TRINITY_DN569_c1_g1_i1.p1  ORF type:complete len:353 (-),score=104.56 TRINITY_DN569_c1_g1_i1:15-1073(-)